MCERVIKREIGCVLVRVRKRESGYAPVCVHLLVRACFGMCVIECIYERDRKKRTNERGKERESMRARAVYIHVHTRTYTFVYVHADHMHGRNTGTIP